MKPKLIFIFLLAFINSWAQDSTKTWKFSIQNDILFYVNRGFYNIYPFNPEISFQKESGTVEPGIRLQLRDILFSGGDKSGSDKDHFSTGFRVDMPFFIKYKPNWKLTPFFSPYIDIDYHSPTSGLIFISTGIIYNNVVNTGLLIGGRYMLNKKLFFDASYRFYLFEWNTYFYEDMYGNISKESINLNQYSDFYERGRLEVGVGIKF